MFDTPSFSSLLSLTVNRIPYTPYFSKQHHHQRTCKVKNIGFILNSFNTHTQFSWQSYSHCRINISQISSLLISTVTILVQTIIQTISFFFSNHFLTRLLQQLPNRQPSRSTFIFSCSKLFDAFYLRKKNSVQILCGSYSVSYDLSLANISIFISTYPPCLPWFLPFIVHSHQNFLDLKSLVSDPPCCPELCPFRSSPDKLFIIQVSAQTSFLKGLFQPPYLPFLEVTLDLIALVVFFHCTCHLKLSCLLTYLLLYSFIICFSC